VLFANLLAWAGVLTFGLGLHPFATYPLSLMALTRLRPRPHRTGPVLPDCKVAVCVCAYNEAEVIGARIDNLLSLRATVRDLEILVYVDAAEDGTAAIVQRYGNAIRAHVSPVRQGKSCGMNQLVASTDADLIVFSDANVTFAPDALPNLLAPFADDAVGCVCGHLIYRSTDRPNATAETGSLYWRIEERIKSLESRVGSVMGADGSIFAIRRRLHRPPPGDLIDDMFVSLSILCGGHRIVHAENATAYEDAVSRPAEEYRRKVRIACQAFNVHRALWHSLRRLPWLERYMYASHKVLRWLAIYFLASSGLCFLLAVLLAGGFRVASAVAAAGLGAGAAAYLRPIRPIAKAADVMAAFVATGIGVFRSLSGERFQTWSPAVSARRAVLLPRG
jgi:cellulose synthase/poly-beta-1,6-N-acetylglucosamine synthase-like glycosyltransferase